MDLTTNYMGLSLRNPLVASASPLAQTLAGVQRLADAGVGAVVLPSLFEEQLRREAEQDARLAEAGTESFAESLSYLPDALSYPPDAQSYLEAQSYLGAQSYLEAQGQAGSRRYLSLLERAVAAVDVPVIASLNGVTTGGWTDYASAMEQAGAAAIELNIYYLPGDPLTPGRDVEQRHVDILGTVKATVSIPVAVKLGPYFSSTGEMALRLDKFGADGLVLFNRFMQPGIDPETLTVSTGFELSSPVEARLPRAWIALLRGQVRASLAGSTGVEDAADVAAYLLVGADVVMTTSSLLRHGPGHAGVLLDGLAAWMQRKGFAAVGDLRGLLRVPPGTDQAAYERSGYLTAIQGATLTYQPR
jgi:dihydroorotate dehydrogenase (fumarate)